eukprot:6213955-Pleurochrysis_carterae.AAC.1
MKTEDEGADQVRLIRRTPTRTMTESRFKRQLLACLARLNLTKPPPVTAGPMGASSSLNFNEHD